MTDSHDRSPPLTPSLQDLDIGVLVNNVGYYQGYPAYFGEVSEEVHYKTVQINCHPVVQMTHMLLPKMVAKKRGVIVNVSSAVADHPMQLNTVYSAIKRFDSHFSDALRKEYSSKGIIVQDVRPFMVATAMTRTSISLGGMAENSRFLPNPITYTRAAVATIGIQHTTYGYFYHALQMYLARLFPVWLLDWMLWKSLLDARNTYLKTKAKQK